MPDGIMMQFLCAGTANMMAAAFTNPVDVVKARHRDMMMQWL